jgi:NAD(P)-dependent dehydrogenase (short-subunit alcohol dehydrogenase family)
MILITGASEGIGFACALAVLERTTTTVLITGRSGAKLERARASVPAPARARLLTMVSDQSSRRDVDQLVGRLRAADAIEGAILGVGVNPLYEDGPCRIHRLSTERVESTIATNCTHTLILSAALLERFRGQRHGALVWIGSQATAAGMPGAALYTATKSFLSGLARSAAREYAGYGIRAHVAHPGPVRTPRTAAFTDRFADRHRLQVAEPADVGRPIVELLLGGAPWPVEVNLP